MVADSTHGNSCRNRKGNAQKNLKYIEADIDQNNYTYQNNGDQQNDRDFKELASFEALHFRANLMRDRVFVTVGIKKLGV